MIETIKWIFINFFQGVFVFRYPICCVTEFTVRCALGQAPAGEWLRRQGVEIETDPECDWVVYRSVLNTYWEPDGELKYVPCLLCERRNPGEWVPA